MKLKAAACSEVDGEAKALWEGFQDIAGCGVAESAFGLRSNA